jgi:Putative prokaryotic signal transducing protein
MTEKGGPAGGSADDSLSAESLLMRTWSDGEASVVQQILVEYGIPCRVVSDITHTVWPLSVDGLGEVRVLVAADRLEEATEILAEHRRQGLEIVEGGASSGGEGDDA